MINFKVGQEVPKLPGIEIAQGIDAIGQTLYMMASQGPLGIFTKAIPPPPKVSAIFAQGAKAAQGKVPTIPGLPVPPPFPLLPAAEAVKQTIVGAGGEKVVNPFT